MDKKMFFLYGWVANVCLLLIIILMPKKSDIYGLLSLFSMVMIFVVPLVLSFLQGVLTTKEGHELDIYSGIPNVGCAMVMMLTFVKFIGSIEKIGRAQMVTILILFIVIELLLGFLKINYKKMSKKQYICIEVASYLSLVVFFFCAMIMSFDFGII